MLWADFASTGRLLGCNLMSSPGEWDEALGGPDWPLVEVRKGRMRRDYGVVEILFENIPAGWVCVNASLLPYRITGDDGEMIPPGIRDAYGQVGADVPFSSVASEMDVRRVNYEEIADRDKFQHVRYWVDRSEVIIAVEGEGARHPGRVWSLGRANDAKVWRRPQM